MMSLYIRRILFAFYVLFVKMRDNGGRQSAPAPLVLTWRHAYFLFWHRFLWRMGRVLLGVFTEVKPLSGDLLSPTAYEYYVQFNEMCARDRENRPFVDRMTKQKSFPLADDTVKALCLFYRYHTHIAPWQYGKVARERARAHMAGFFVVSIFLLLLTWLAHAVGYIYAPLVMWAVFFASLFALVGFFASNCILQIATKTEKLFAENKSP
jgi:hypothetical protein